MGAPALMGTNQKMIKKKSMMSGQWQERGNRMEG